MPEHTPDRRAILLGIATSAFAIGLVLLALEVGLRIVGYGDPTTRRDPFDGFEGTNPMFVEQTIPGEPTRMVPAPNKAELLGTEGFLRDKPAGSTRIFTFGGSTTYGSPWGPAGSYSASLADALAQRHPDHLFEVINCGVVGWGSSRNLQQLREATAYEPDVFVVYVGINDLRDAQFHPAQTRRGSFEARVLSVLLSSRALYFVSERLHVLRALLFGAPMTGFAALTVAKVTEEGSFAAPDYYRVPLHDGEALATARENDAGGLRDRLRTLVPSSVREMLYRWRFVSEDEAYARFQANVTAMIETARAHDVRIVFLLNAYNPEVSSLLYTPTVSLASVAPEDRERWEERYATGVAAARKGACDEALVAFDDVVALYGTEAADRDPLLTLYRGKCLERTGRFDEARAELAKRVTSEQARLNGILREVTSRFDVHVLDLPALLAEHASHGLVGYGNFFVDNVHLTPRGYRLVGWTLASELEAWGLLGSLGAPAAPNLPAHDEDVQQTEFRNANALAALGWSAFQQGRPEDAMRLGLAAIEIEPTEMQAHLLLGYAYEQLGRREETEAALDTVRRLWQEGFE